MTGLAVHALHYGLLVAGLLTVAVLVLTVRRGRRDGHDGHEGHDEHDERVRRLRDTVSSAVPSDEDPGVSGPPSAGCPGPPLAGSTRDSPLTLARTRSGARD